MNRKKEKGFALVLSLVLLLVMSLMGGSLIVITSSDHQSNNNSDQYQQAFYVAETGLMQGEKWVINEYLGPWTKADDIKSGSDMGLIDGELKAYKNAIDEYHEHDNEMKRHKYLRGPPLNDFPADEATDEATDEDAEEATDEDAEEDIEFKKTDCMKSFKNIDVDKTLQIAGGGSLPKKVNFINIVGPILLNNESCTDYETCNSSDDYNSDELVEKTDSDLGFEDVGDIVEKEVKYLRRFEYEFFVINVGPAAYKGSGSSIAKTTSSSDSQGTAYKIYACGIFYGKSDKDADPHNGDIEILIPLETVIVMPS